METAIYVLLGALATALAFLLVLPAVSRRATRLAERRAALTALSEADARAERDALRARHAVEVALVERRASEAEARWSAAQIELGRQVAGLVARDAALADKSAEIARQREEIAGLTQELRDAQTENGARESALIDFSAQRDAALAREARTAERLRDALKRAAETEAALAARIAKLTRELEQARMEVELSAAEARVAQVRARAAAEEARDAAALGDLAREIATLRERLSASEARADALTEGDALLREAVARIGREMVARHAPPEPASEREPADALTPPRLW